MRYRGREPGAIWFISLRERAAAAPHEPSDRIEDNMRYATFAIAMLCLGAVTPALAAPAWDECYQLGMDRGVHVELGELPGWMDECLSGKIPFDGKSPKVHRNGGRVHGQPTRSHSHGHVSSMN